MNLYNHISWCPIYNMMYYYNISWQPYSFPIDRNKEQQRVQHRYSETGMPTCCVVGYWRCQTASCYSPFASSDLPVVEDANRTHNGKMCGNPLQQSRKESGWNVWKRSKQMARKWDWCLKFHVPNNWLKSSRSQRILDGHNLMGLASRVTGYNHIYTKLFHTGTTPLWLRQSNFSFGFAIFSSFANAPLPFM